MENNAKGKDGKKGGRTSAAPQHARKEKHDSVKIKNDGERGGGAYNLRVRRLHATGSPRSNPTYKESV